MQWQWLYVSAIPVMALLCGLRGQLKMLAAGLCCVSRITARLARWRGIGCRLQLAGVNLRLAWPYHMRKLLRENTYDRSWLKKSWLAEEENQRSLALHYNGRKLTCESHPVSGNLSISREAAVICGGESGYNPLGEASERRRLENSEKKERPISLKWKANNVESYLFSASASQLKKWLKSWRKSILKLKRQRRKLAKAERSIG